MKDLSLIIEQKLINEPVDHKNFLDYWKFCKKTRRTLRSIEAEIEAILLKSNGCVEE